MKAIPEITVQLIHIHGGLKGEIQEFRDSPISVGRLPELTLVFPPDEPGVSREHARIEREELIHGLKRRPAKHLDQATVGSQPPIDVFDLA